MITLIEAKNYRCLQYIRQPLGPFHVLVGPNASGKTTFLDVVAFLGDLVSGGLDEAVGKRTSNYYDLIWGRQGDGFELAVEAAIPEAQQPKTQRQYSHIRYEIAVGIDRDTGEFVIQEEYLLLVDAKCRGEVSSSSGVIPNVGSNGEPVVRAAPGEHIKAVIARFEAETELYYQENDDKTAYLASDGGPRHSLLENLPENEKRFPASTWFKRLLRHNVRKIELDGAVLRKASRPGLSRTIMPDASNLPWVINDLRIRHISQFELWIAHLQTALPDLTDIKTVVRDDDRHRYLVLCYQGSLQVPSWMVSDGTLRLIALTLIAYQLDIQGVYLIEEPENGIHPCAIETMFQSLSSVYDAQVLLATHSPVILSVADADDVLCFSKTADGAAEIVSGSEHPALINWHGETNLGVLFAGGVLG